VPQAGDQIEQVLENAVGHGVAGSGRGGQVIEPTYRT
jgi:hypothetical protein